jgi:integration host factor subunit beta
MNKSTLIKQLKLKTGQKKTEQAVNVLFEEIIQQTTQHKTVEFRTLGQFFLKEQKPRQSRNPKTGETLHIDTKLFFQFKASKNLQNELSNPKNVPRETQKYSPQE